ncbi:unnamed protein product, partial [Sphacelaria rigidula]
QFGFAGAAVARIWADKILEWVSMGQDTPAEEAFWMMVLNPLPRIGFSPLAAGLQTVCVLIVMRGVKLGKRITTVLTTIKV